MIVHYHRLYKNEFFCNFHFFTLKFFTLNFLFIYNFFTLISSVIYPQTIFVRRFLYLFFSIIFTLFFLSFKLFVFKIYQSFVPGQERLAPNACFFSIGIDKSRICIYLLDVFLEHHDFLSCCTGDYRS